MIPQTANRAIAASTGVAYERRTPRTLASSSNAVAKLASASAARKLTTAEAAATRSASSISVPDATNQTCNARMSNATAATTDQRAAWNQRALTSQMISPIAIRANPITAPAGGRGRNSLAFVRTRPNTPNRMAIGCGEMCNSGSKRSSPKRSMSSSPPSLFTQYSNCRTRVFTV